MTPARRRRWHGFALACVVLLAAALRFGGITKVGIRFTDEGAFVSDASLWHRCARVLIDPVAVSAVFRGDKRTLQQRMDTLGVDFGARYVKPSQGYTFLGALTMFLVGDRPAALLVLNALCGTLAVAVLYAFAAVLFHRTIALWAALLLAVSPYHLVYCRSAWSEATAGLFVLAGVLFWVLGRRGRWTLRRAYLLSGLALGHAMTCHYRSAYVPALLILVDLVGIKGIDQVQRAIGRRRGDVLRGWAFLAVGIAVPLVAIEGVFRAARLAATLSDSYLPVLTFLEGGWEWVKFLRAAAAVYEGELLHPQAPVAFAGYFIHWHGAAAAAVTLLGVLLVFRAKGPAKFAAVFVVATFAMAPFQPFTVARALSTTIPFACLCLAVGVERLVAWARPWSRLQPVWAVVLAALVVVPACRKAADLCGKRSSLADACAFVADRGGRVAVLDEWKYRTYLNPEDTVDRRAFRRFDSAKEALDHLREADVRWLIADPQYWHYRTWDRPWNKRFAWWQAFYRHVDQRAVRVADFDHMIDYRWEFLCESPDTSGLKHLDEMTCAGAGFLRVYDLQAAARGTDNPIAMDPRVSRGIEAQASRCTPGSGG